MNRILISLSTVIAALASPLALAHSGEHLANHSLSHGFSAGLLHPLTGVDHLLVLLTIGFLVFSQRAAMSKIAAAASLLVMGLVVGSVLGAFALLEAVIIGSLALAALGLVLRVKKARLGLQQFNLILCSLTLIGHGWAHGVELSGNSFTFTVGMSISALAIMACGFGLARGAQILGKSNGNAAEQL